MRIIDMIFSRQRLARLTVLSSCAVACGGRLGTEEGFVSPPDAVADTTSETTDTSTSDVGADVASLEPCSTPGSEESRRCDVCKKQRRICTTDGWSAFGACEPVTCPPGWDTMSTVGAPAARGLHSTVWTGTEMIVWGGSVPTPPYLTASGGAYRPSTDTWRSLGPTTLSERDLHATAWTGSEMLVWGGQNNSGKPYGDGAAYSPATDDWTILPPAPITPRMGMSSVWTGKELVVWGGYDGANCVADGAAYEPIAKTWRLIAPPASFVGRTGHRAVWVNGKMIVFGGVRYGAGALDDAAAFDPASDTWTILPKPGLDGRSLQVALPLAGDEQLVFQGGQGIEGSGRDDGALFDTTTTSWSAIAAPAAAILPNARRMDVLAWSAGRRFFIWGGFGGSGYFADGATYDADTKTWTSLPPVTSFAAREAGGAVWTGSEAILWGGFRGTEYFADGRIYRP